MLGPAGVSRDEGQIDLVLLGAGESNLGLLSLLLDPLQRIRLFAEIHPAVLLEFVKNPIHDPSIPIVATQMGIAVSSFYLEDSITDFQDGDIECAAAEIVHRNLFVLLLIETVSQRGCGWLIYNAKDLEPGDSASVL